MEKSTLQFLFPGYFKVRIHNKRNISYLQIGEGLMSCFDWVLIVLLVLALPKLVKNTK